MTPSGDFVVELWKWPPSRHTSLAGLAGRRYVCGSVRTEVPRTRDFGLKIGPEGCGWGAQDYHGDTLNINLKTFEKRIVIEGLLDPWNVRDSPGTAGADSDTFIVVETHFIRR